MLVRCVEVEPKESLTRKPLHHCSYSWLMNWMIFRITLALLSENVITLLLLRVGWLKKNAKIDVSHGDTICWKHRENYGCKFRIRSSKCMYPGHVETKRKPTVKPMSLPAVLQTERMFTSPAVKVILPFGASWCTNCMVRIHPPKWEDYSKQMGDVCKACYQDHSSATGYNHITLLYNIYLYTNIYTNFSFSF